VTEEIARIGREITAPKLINIVAGSLTPELGPATLGKPGYSIAIYQAGQASGHRASFVR
jgi:2-methylisocitrate lyase-like PEP mutase family enzyme